MVDRLATPAPTITTKRSAMSVHAESRSMKSGRSAMPRGRTCPMPRSHRNGPVMSRPGRLWIAIASSSVSYVIGDRSRAAALAFMEVPLKERLARHAAKAPPDGHNVYREAVETVFGGEVDFALLLKLYGKPEGVSATESRSFAGESHSGPRKSGLQEAPAKPS